MNTNCSSLVKEHGCKLWLSNFLGYSLLFWFVSWISTTASFPMSCGEFFSSMESAFSSPMAMVKFLVFGGLFLIIPAFIYSAGASATVDVVSRNQSSIDTYFTQGLLNLGKMYRLTLASIVCYLPAMFVSKHASFQFTDFNFSSDNLLGLLGIVLYAVTALSLLHAPYILVANNTTACDAIRQSFNLFSTNCTGVFVSMFNVALIYGVLVGSAYLFHPDIFDSLHPMRFLLASLALTLSMFAVTYRYFKRFRSEDSSTAQISGGTSPCTPSSTSCPDTPTTDTSSCTETTSSTCSETESQTESLPCPETTSASTCSDSTKAQSNTSEKKSKKNK